MQDRYAGDIGDFGKFGLLKAVERQGLSIGVNWYFTCPSQEEEKRNDGGKPIDKRYSGCDEVLFFGLCSIFEMPDRSVRELENHGFLKNTIYYHEPVKIGSERQQWHKEAVERLASAKVIFLDPDNGLITKTTRKTSKYAAKYILDDEIRDYLEIGKAVIFYQHRPRKNEKTYFLRLAKESALSVINFPAK